MNDRSARIFSSVVPIDAAILDRAEPGAPDRNPSAAETGVGVVLMVAASVALTLGFACALPLAAFACMAALVFRSGAAVAAVLAVWLANQAVGFGWMHYPLDFSTFAWGAGLGVIGLLSLGAARFVLSRSSGYTGIAASFLAAFVVYEGAVFLGCAMTRDCAGAFAAPVVIRVFLINAASFGVFLALRGVWLRLGFSRLGGAVSALRHA